MTDKSPPREAILARRAKFVAAALACAGLSTHAQGCCPQTCLEPAMDPDAAPPLPCLTIAPEPSPVPDAARKDAAGDARNKAQPCLSVAPPRSR